MPGKSTPVSMPEQGELASNSRAAMYSSIAVNGVLLGELMAELRDYTSDART